MDNGLLWDLLPTGNPAHLMMFSEGRSFSYPHYVEYRDETENVFEGVSRSIL
jgi:hypothetical protein